MSKILNLKQYDLVFTTSFVYTHGVSGHLYELIDYYHVSKQAGINCAILLADGITLDLFKTAITDKYNFSDTELSDMLDNTIECYRPLIIMANNLCIVDGSWRMLDCTVYANNVFLFRCSEDDFTFFHNHKSIKRAHLMQDFNLYPERFADLDMDVIDYVKKILWQKYHQPKPVKTDTALLYLTTNCRILPVKEIKRVLDKYSYAKYLLVTNEPSLYAELASDTVTVAQAPVQNIFEQFDTYIYTATPKRADCSPRFIVECAVFNKDVVYEIDYVDPGVECRKRAIERNVHNLLLTTDDYFVSYAKEQMNARS